MAYLRKKYIESSDSLSDLDNELEETKIIIKKINIINIKSDEELSNEYNNILKKYWGYDSLKPTQFEIIKKIIVRTVGQLF